ncbi:MAG TPA: hypothetical protein VHV55_09530 [Pirellulales bacterium]|jgi:gas vesicle protein|nr:hypothetical protein [Pirellulales bacterium]
MKDFTLALASTGLTIVSWGVYGPLMNSGVRGMGGSHLLPFIAVGIAYFLIAVLAAGAVLVTRGERGQWTASGVTWSVSAGIGTAVGALGIILALSSGGHPVYVMPLVFGGAPVVNTFVTMALSKTFKQGHPMFYAGLILVIAGAATVLIFKPARPAPAATAATTQSHETHPAAAPGHDQSWTSKAEAKAAETAKVTMFILLTALCWGAYGPVLHKGQVLMGGSRLRPFICVGISYFLVAVLVPLTMLSTDHGAFTMSGGLWSLASGAAGAIGSLGIIMAFNYGGKPIYVMPLVFGGAPVVNTFVTMYMTGTYGQAKPVFYAGLIMVVAGAVTVLLFAPKAGPKPAAAPAPKPSKSAKPAEAHGGRRAD